jgi:hypothetical protein
MDTVLVTGSVVRKSFLWLMAAFGLVLLGSLAAGRWLSFVQSSAPSGGARVASSARGWESVPVAAQLSLSRGIGRDQRQYDVHAAARGSLIARGGGLSAEFRADGVSVAGASGVALRLGVSAVGRAGSLRAVGEITPMLAGSNRVSYAHRGVREWYANGPLGLEQGFVLARRPAGLGLLTVQVGALPAGARARLERGGSELLVSGRAGRGSLGYGDVSVTDARGRPVRARIALLGRRVLLRIADRGVRYPLWIDPLVQQAQLTAKSAADGDELGYSVAVSGDTIVAGAPDHTVGSHIRQGAIYVFVKPKSGWRNATQTAELTASDGATNNWLGRVVSVSGDTIVASAPFHQVGSNRAQGAVYVFVRPESGWKNATQTAELTAGDGNAEDWLGVSPGSLAVAGNTIVVGSPRHPLSTTEGVAYVFVKPASGWRNATQTAELTASDSTASDQFGAAASIWGSTIVVGATGSIGHGGAAYVFVRPASGWKSATQTAKLTASNDTANNDLGQTVAVSGDTVVASVRLHRANPNNDRTVLYVYAKPPSGWKNATQTAELTETNSREDDSLGASLAVLGNTILAGDPNHRFTANSINGAAYVFTRPERGWRNATQTAVLVASDGADNESFGLAVALSDTTIVAGAPNYQEVGRHGNTNNRGAVYAFDTPSP